ncbi:MFS-type transporter SLC18B1 [Nymphon striatum]|nr:MFS-type transporter SLC18B1 [Nymphon striatum]
MTINPKTFFKANGDILPCIGKSKAIEALTDLVGVATLKKSDTIIGLIMSTNTAIYAILTPILGIIVDKWGFIRSPLIVGLNTRGFGYLLLASSIMFGFKTTSSTGIIASMVIGTGMVGSVVPLFKYILLQARDSGFESNFYTSSMVATLLTFVQSFGSFIGPLLGGQIIDKVGFEICFIYFGFFTMSASLVILADCIRVKLCSSVSADRETQEEWSPLVINNDSTP